MSFGFHIKTHFEVIQKRMEILDCSRSDVEEKLIKLVKYQNFMFDCCEKLVDLFYGPMAVEYIYAAMNISLIVLQFVLVRESLGRLVEFTLKECFNFRLTMLWLGLPTFSSSLLC